jgi:hypothetical protein
MLGAGKGDIPIEPVGIIPGLGKGAIPGGGGSGAIPTFLSAAAAAVATDAYFSTSPAGLAGKGAGFIEEPFGGRMPLLPKVGVVETGI